MTSTARSYFEKMYESDADPWGFETSPYERRKYALTIATLPRERYRSAFEPGCSVGVLTEQLASRCDRLLATDLVTAALEKARARLEHSPHVVLASLVIPEAWPEDRFDLIVLSEIAYYFDAFTLERVIERTLESTGPGAHIIGVHWRGQTNYPLSGDEAHEVIGSCGALKRLVHHVEADFLLDVWERRP
jgi:predicted TPR repeat methyltransferase